MIFDMTLDMTLTHDTYMTLTHVSVMLYCHYHIVSLTRVNFFLNKNKIMK